MEHKKTRKKTTAEKISVLYCVDGKNRIYLTLLKMSMHSFKDNCPSAVFYVIYDNIPEEDLIFMRENFPVRFFKFPQERFKREMKVLTEDTNVVHPSIFWRFFAPEILPKNIKQILHIDSDILLGGRLGFPKIQNPENNLISAVEYPEGYYKLDASRYKGVKCFHGGVNWLNLPLMREFCFSHQCVALAEEDRSLRYEEGLMSIVARGMVEFHKVRPDIFANVTYYFNANASPSFSLLHYAFFKRRSGSLIHPKFKKIFNYYHKKVTGSSYDFRVPLYLLPFKLVPYKARGWLLSLFFGRVYREELTNNKFKSKTRDLTT